MKKLLIVFLVQGILSSFAYGYSNNCKVNIVESDMMKDEIVDTLEKHGFEVVDSKSEADLSVTSGIGNFNYTTCGRERCTKKSYVAASTNLHRFAFDDVDLFFLRAASFMNKTDKTQIIVQGFARKKFLQSSSETIHKSINDFDAELEKAQVSCKE